MRASPSWRQDRGVWFLREWGSAADGHGWQPVRPSLGQGEASRNSPAISPAGVFFDAGNSPLGTLGNGGRRTPKQLTRIDFLQKLDADLWIEIEILPARRE